MKTVFVGLSGGVDSAVSALLLKREGYRVVGAFIKVWEPDFLQCTSQEDRLSAMRVAAHLEIPFVSYDLAEEYKKSVVDYFIGEYKAGRTPNPDVMCNRTIKFGAFWERARADGADFIATGHYAQRIKNSDFVNHYNPNLIENSDLRNHYRLYRGVDETKDQSYFLWTLTQDDLSHALFPIGGVKKSAVRRIASKAGLPNAGRKDSQGLCFLGHVDMREFLKHYLPVKRGSIYGTGGEKLGAHDGVAFYTIGQRVSLSTGKKMYVVGKDVKKNELFTSPNPHLIENSDLRNHYNHYGRIELEGVNWIGEAPKEGKEYEAEIRYHGERHPVTVGGNTVTFETPVLAAAGQSLVLYDPKVGMCLGGGIIVGNADC